MSAIEIAPSIPLCHCEAKQSTVFERLLGILCSLIATLAPLVRNDIGIFNVGILSC
ncbi:MAG: hypothetical protein K2N12_07225 [Helicobacter sp.]|nr:hypothetical protein [Helicobacter sp.]